MVELHSSKVKELCSGVMQGKHEKGYIWLDVWCSRELDVIIKKMLDDSGVR